MQIVVCIKQIIDPEIPIEQFRLDPVIKRQVRGGLSLVISAYDQNAVEVALQLKEKSSASVTVLSVGEPEAQGAIKSAMGMGADGGILVSDPILAGSDSFGIAYVLAQAIRKIGTVDLVLTGCVSGDTGSKLVTTLLGEELGAPAVNFVSRIELQGGKAILRRIVEDGYERVEASLPLVAGILSDDTNVPRYSKLKDIMAAARKTVPVWKAADLGLDSKRVGGPGRRISIREMVQPTRESHCELIPGDSPAEQAERLAERLRELKVI